MCSCLSDKNPAQAKAGELQGIVMSWCVHSVVLYMYVHPSFATALLVTGTYFTAVSATRTNPASLWLQKRISQLCHLQEQISHLIPLLVAARNALKALSEIETDPTSLPAEGTDLGALTDNRNKYSSFIRSRNGSHMSFCQIQRLWSELRQFLKQTF